MIIAIASGKGGTGKTSVATSLALAIPDAQYIDCDVEEPNGHLFLHPDIDSRETVAVPLPRIDEQLCTLCGKCAEACEFNALAVSKQRVLVFPDLCHGCGACSYVCPEDGAIVETERAVGEVEFGTAPGTNGAAIAFAQGRLKVGEPTAVPVIKAVKKNAAREDIVVLDAPPGTACPMVEVLRGADYCLLVTEPTPFGLNDLKLAVGVARELEVPCGILLNRSDIGDGAVAEYCREEALPVLMEVPFDRGLAVAYSRGVSWVVANPAYGERFRALYEAIRRETGA